jgi:hypothetical protein
LIPTLIPAMCPRLSVARTTHLRSTHRDYPLSPYPL